jgi:hypothetical protein
MGARWGFGYGRLLVTGRRTKLAHRISWLIHNKELPEGMSVLHKCDVPFCVNPSHLFLGTHQDNVDDMVRKGRSTRGEANSHAKLTADNVLEIRRVMRSGNVTQSEMAKKYNVSISHIGSIKHRRTWKHLPT